MTLKECLPLSESLCLGQLLVPEVPTWLLSPKVQKLLKDTVLVRPKTSSDFPLSLLFVLTDSLPACRHAPFAQRFTNSV